MVLVALAREKTGITNGTAGPADAAQQVRTVILGVALEERFRHDVDLGKRWLVVKLQQLRGHAVSVEPELDHG